MCATLSLQPECSNTLNLLFDIGNSTLKWGWLEEDDQGTLNVGEHLPWPAQPEHVITSLTTHLSSEQLRQAQCHVANVGPRQALYPLLKALENLCGRYPRLHFSEPVCCGVQNGYQDFSQLGVDRWLGLIAARRLSKRPQVMIVDAGTALTIDLLNEQKHAGGLITPGSDMMMRCLQHNTANLAHALRQQMPSSASGTEGLGRTTQEAITAGVHYMTAAYLQTLHTDLQARFRSAPAVILSGGQADFLQTLLRFPHTRHIPHLVLEGLADVVRNHR